MIYADGGQGFQAPYDTKEMLAESTLDEIENAIKAVVGQLGATSIKDMGKVMGALKNQYAGQMDFGAASAIIKKILA